MVATQQRYIVQIKDLKTHFYTLDGVVQAVDGVSLEIEPGESLGLVGESGCGKSVTAFSILRLLPKKTARIVHGNILYDRGDGSPAVELTTVDPNGDLIRNIRGNEIAMIFQEPLTSLSPMHTVGNQIIEAIQLHQGLDDEAARQQALSWLDRVGMGTSGANQIIDQYPHRLSGGQRQRAMIAMALSCKPQLLIADEPTTALDVTIQAQILELMKDLQEQLGMAILMITHNLGVIAEMCERVAVMYMGKIVESGDVRTIFRHPIHPYTVGLMRSIPQLGRQVKARLTPIPGSIPDPYSVPSGCAFLPRCPVPKMEACRQEVPLIEVEPGHFARCVLYG
ncbi:MAG TPA: ABC transporter ATP-binding protein [Anaerolineae bacterium]|nr:ABC transporter ATP-binding protein [Anaerolineae bacterium]HQH37265.1 ABC transporter ATP-binding protein [Anaerolineae bacterium]